MPLVFPPNPSPGDTYTDDNSVVWQYNGVVWNVVTGATKKQFNGARLSFSATYNLNSTESVVNWDVEDFDTGQYWNVSQPSRITINETGYYNINTILFATSLGAGFTVKVKKNGSTTLIEGTFNANQSASYNQTIQLNSGDYLEVYASESGSTGGLTTSSYFEIVQYGLGVGTSTSPYAAFSGAKAILSSSFNTTSTPTAVTWTSTTYDTNANALAGTYWNGGSPTRLTVSVAGYYQISSYILNGSAGTNYTLTLKKNGSTNLANVTGRNPNDQALINEIFSLTANDYLELFVSSATNGSVTNATYFEIIRLGF